MDCIEETIEVLYNSEYYGEYGLSEKAKKMFEERKTNDSTEDERDTPLILQIFHELGDEFNDEYCKVKSEKIPKKYEKFYGIYKYDGKEEVYIDYNQYDLISTIFHETMTDTEKINKIKDKYSRYNR